MSPGDWCATLAGSRRLVLALGAVLAIAGCAPKPVDRALPGPAILDSAELNQCLVELAATGAEFERVADRTDGNGCSVVGAVQLRSLTGDEDSIGLSNIGALDCRTAVRFAGWARYGAGRAARQLLGSPVARIETMGSYSCRNIAGTARRSAHARAQAVDVGGFVLADGRRITVLGGWPGSSSDSEFLRVVHRSACRRFGTVLGPGYDAAHRDHFHLELTGGGFCR
jgi:hypothetical protein